MTPRDPSSASDRILITFLRLVAERGIDADLDARRRGALEASLGRWIAADGTLRIAAEAVCLRHQA